MGIRCIALFIAAAVLAFGITARADQASQQLMSKLQWRNIGPYIGGRVVAVAGVPNTPNLFYMGGAQGGIWRSADYGGHWTNITDGKIPGIADPIGALAVAPSNVNVIYAGTGDSAIRVDFDSGAGLYKSTDAGKTWAYSGLADTHVTERIAIDPHDPNIVYVAAMGHVFKPNAERGIFKTTDGGKTWRKVLFVNADTGGVDVTIDPHDTKTVYAALWQAQRVPWKLTSGGPGGGLYKTNDAGAHWTKISNNRGFARGMLGKIGVSVAASNPRIIYATVQARDGGIFRSNDAGASWRRTNDEMKLRQRGFYYTEIFADPTNPNVAYAPMVDGVYKTADGGRTFSLLSPRHGDCHVIWINPRNPKILLEGDDGGATVSIDGSSTWSDDENQPTGQFYKVALDDEFPFHLYGAEQDEGSLEGPSASANVFGIGPSEWRYVALGESTWVAPQPDSPSITYGSSYYSTMVRLDRTTGTMKNVSPWPRYMIGESASETKYRFGWTHPILFNQSDRKELLVGSQVVFSSRDYGKTWSVISPDLTRNDPRTEAPSGGPIFLDQTNAETFPDISALSSSPLDGSILWAGSADGLVHVTTDHGAHWSLVTPPQLPQWAQISTIEPSHTDKGTAYLSASRYMWDDTHPYVYKTTDYGAHWTALTNGLPSDQYVFVVRQDPREPRLLFAGTRSTVYVSLDDGAQWQPLTLNLPGVQVRDLAIGAREGELVAATHGRAFWILDDLALLEQLARQTTYSAASMQLFSPETAWVTQAYGGSLLTYGDGGGNIEPTFGPNPNNGAAVFFNLPASYDGRTPATLTFYDGTGSVVRTFTLHRGKPAPPLSFFDLIKLDAVSARERIVANLTAVSAGMNVFQWDLRYSPAYDVPGFYNVFTADYPDTADGPTVVPGNYTAVLQYGGQALRAPVHVALDPRVHPDTGDLDARLALEREILSTIDRLDRAVAAALHRRAALPANRRTQVDDAIAQLITLHADSSEAHLMRGSRVREQLGFLLNSLEGAYEKPTAGQYQAYDELKTLADTGIDRLNAP